MHHNEQQPTCLSVYTAIQNPTTCIDFERQKLLHSRPIIDSKLAPIFQIVTHPPRDKCTKKLDKVCPHGYGPSWRTICNPKDKGGAAVINVQQQSNALLLIVSTSLRKGRLFKFHPSTGDIFVSCSHRTSIPHHAILTAK